MEWTADMSADDWLRERSEAALGSTMHVGTIVGGTAQLIAALGSTMHVGTIVGGTAQLIAALVTDLRLETFEIEVNR